MTTALLFSLYFNHNLHQESLGTICLEPKDYFYLGTKEFTVSLMRPEAHSQMLTKQKQQNHKYIFLTFSSHTCAKNMRVTYSFDVEKICTVLGFYY